MSKHLFPFPADGLAVTAIDRVKREFKRDVVLKSRKPTRDMPSMEEVKEEVDWMLVSDLVDVDMSSKTVEFDRALSGWYGFREDKTEAVGSFQVSFALHRRRQRIAEAHHTSSLLRA